MWGPRVPDGGKASRRRKGGHSRIALTTAGGLTLPKPTQPVPWIQKPPQTALSPNSPRFCGGGVRTLLEFERISLGELNAARDNLLRQRARHRPARPSTGGSTRPGPVRPPRANGVLGVGFWRRGATCPKPDAATDILAAARPGRCLGFRARRPDHRRDRA